MNRLAVQVEDVRSRQVDHRRLDEGISAVRNIQKIGLAAKADMERSPGNRRLHRLGWIGGHSRVTSNSINGQRAQPGTADSIVEEIDPRIVLVATLEGAIMGVHPAGGTLRNRHTVLR